MKLTLVLYFHPEHKSKDHFPVLCNGDVAGYVRVEVTDFNTVKALDHARPRPGETVLNSVEVEVP